MAFAAWSMGMIGKSSNHRGHRETQGKQKRQFSVFLCALCGKALAVTSVPRLPLHNFSIIFLHLCGFPVISNCELTSAEMPGIALNREPRRLCRIKGDEVAESGSIEEEAIEIGNS